MGMTGRREDVVTVGQVDIWVPTVSQLQISAGQAGGVVGSWTYSWNPFWRRLFVFLKKCRRGMEETDEVSRGQSSGRDWSWETGTGGFDSPLLEGTRQQGLVASHCRQSFHRAQKIEAPLWPGLR